MQPINFSKPRWAGAIAILCISYAAITLKIQSADRILVFLSADQHNFVGLLKLLH